MLFNYHQKVIEEMKHRKYSPDATWEQFEYRGKRSAPLDRRYNNRSRREENYPEHDKNYLHLCIKNLTNKINSAPEGKYNKSEVYRLMEFIEENRK
jgi:uncharacterized protein (TIGR02328 family)